jgi:hypothetical protein
VWSFFEKRLHRGSVIRGQVELRQAM